MDERITSADVEYVIRAQNIVKEFSGVRVLDNVNFNLKRGEVHALLGENGAGKSTLMKILAGVYQKTSGELYLNGELVDFKNRRDADAHGIGIIFQEFSQVPQLSVAENLFLGRELRKKFLGGLLKPIDRKIMNKKAKEVMERFNIDIPLNTPVMQLGVANQQLVEICKALFYDAKILIMDEPTAALSEGEIENLFSIISDLKAHGVSVIYISHRLEEIKKICDCATIIRDGKNVDTIDVKNYSVEEIINMMVGRDIHDIYPKKNIEFGDVVLQLDNLCSPGKFEDISFNVRAGEIIGITGLAGAGKSEIARAIYGLDNNCSGDIYVKGEKKTIKTPMDARHLGIAMVPEDRKAHGLILRHNAGSNITLPNLGFFKTKLGALSYKLLNEHIQYCTKGVALRPLDPDKLAHFFSGGNQQKIVIAKWLKAEASVFIFDEPTRGVDVGAKAEIYKLINQLASAGCGVIICSSETFEILGMCNRILVLKNGRVVSVTDDSADDAEIILKAQLGE